MRASSKEIEERCGQFLDEWLALPAPPTAIMCWSDNAAALFADAIQARGLRIPEDIALTAGCHAGGFAQACVAYRSRTRRFFSIAVHACAEPPAWHPVKIAEQNLPYEGPTGGANHRFDNVTKK